MKKIEHMEFVRARQELADAISKINSAIIRVRPDDRCGVIEQRLIRARKYVDSAERLLVDVIFEDSEDRP